MRAQQVNPAEMVPQPSDQIGAYTISIIVIGSATDAIPVPHLYALREHARHAPDF
jgi:hypothetical protein